MNKGLLIVIEGIDGSGKSTQIKLLKQSLASQGHALEVISFPRYGENTYADLISWYLNRQFGKIGEVSPYFVALAYAGDRMLAKPQIEKWLNEGKIVLVNRYVSSSKAHLGASLPAEQREKFLKWLDELEYQTNNLAKADLTILLTVDPKVGQQNVASIHRPDLHEENLKHLALAQDIFLELAKQDPSWQMLDCMENGEMRSATSIHRDIKNILKTKTQKPKLLDKEEITAMISLVHQETD